VGKVFSAVKAFWKSGRQSPSPLWLFSAGNRLQGQSALFRREQNSAEREGEKVKKQDLDLSTMIWKTEAAEAKS